MRAAPPPVIHVCIPSHDEAETLGVLLWKTRRVMGEFGRDYRIVVHDDASTDETADVLARYARVLPLHVLRSAERVGYARSIEALLRHVVDASSYPKRDCAVVVQADFTEDPSDIADLVRVVEGGADIVSGSLYGSADGVPGARRAARWFARATLRGLLRGSPVGDPLSGLRAYRVIVLKKAIRDLGSDRMLMTSEGWGADVELLARLVPYARRVEETVLAPRFGLRARPSRFRPVEAYLSLARLGGRGLWRSEEVAR